MVNAGRILIIAKGNWSNLVNYEQLDLVTRGDIAYLARQASVGVDPSTDIQMTYWQPFGSAAKIADTTTPGLVMPDGTTITIDTTTGLIQASLGISDLTDVVLTTLAEGQSLVYDATAQKWVNGSISYNNLTDKPALKAIATSGNASDVNYTNTTSGLTATNVQTAIDEVTNQVTTKADSSTVTALSTSVSNKHKVTQKAVDTSGWTTDTSSQSGTTLYKKTISLSHVYVESPSVDIGASGVLPTSAQQEAYNLLQYVTCDSAIPCLYLYASDIPTDAFYINVEGVD